MIRIIARIKKRGAAILCRIGLNGLYWRLKKTKDSWETRMGYRLLRQYYDTGCKNHALIMGESDPRKRIALYKKMYDDAFGFIDKHFGIQAFGLGFDGRMVDENSGVFRGRIVLDYGCGFGQSTALIGKYAKKVIGLDASKVCIEAARKEYGTLANVEFVISSSVLLDIPDATMEAVYSNDLFEHLHPDDGVTHLREIYRILVKGGQYLLWTPPAEVGPSDGTKWFFPRGCGFKPICGHLKEYTGDELAALVRQVGFSKIEYPRPGQKTFLLMTK